MGGIIFWLIFGGLVGWLASKIMGTDAQQGMLLNIIVGIVGAMVGGFLWGLLTNDTAPYEFFDIGSWITAIIGACLLLYVLRLAPSRRRAASASGCGVRRISAAGRYTVKYKRGTCTACILLWRM